MCKPHTSSDTAFTHAHAWKGVLLCARSTIIGGAALLLAACATTADRPSQSSYGCMQAVRGSLPSGLADKRAHCLASAWIAQRCSVIEAYFAGAGKEFSDLFTGGDVEWADWRADRAGIACAKRKPHDAVAMCCMERGY